MLCKFDAMLIGQSSTFCILIMLIIVKVPTLNLPPRYSNNQTHPGSNHHHRVRLYSEIGLFVEAKGVAGLGKAGGDGSGGSDKPGQQVPPEVYSALGYAGLAFLSTLTLPLIIYCLNKILNKMEDCFGCKSSKNRDNKEETIVSELKQTIYLDNDSNRLQYHQQNYQIQAVDDSRNAQLIHDFLQSIQQQSLARIEICLIKEPSNT